MTHYFKDTSIQVKLKQNALGIMNVTFVLSHLVINLTRIVCELCIVVLLHSHRPIIRQKFLWDPMTAFRKLWNFLRWFRQLISTHNLMLQTPSDMTWRLLCSWQCVKMCYIRLLTWSLTRKPWSLQWCSIQPLPQYAGSSSAVHEPLLEWSSPQSPAHAQSEKQQCSVHQSAPRVCLPTPRSHITSSD